MKGKLKGIKIATAACAVLAVSAVAAPVASAAVSEYHPTQNSRDFATSAGGWTSVTTNDQILCIIPGVLCPLVTSGHVASGGAGGGYLQDSLLTLTSLVTETTMTWSSPTFTYNGVAAQHQTKSASASIAAAMPLRWSRPSIPPITACSSTTSPTGSPCL